MTLHLTDQQRGVLLELLEASHRAKLHELHHTDSPQYKQLIRGRIAVIEDLITSLAPAEQGV